MAMPAWVAQELQPIYNHFADIRYSIGGNLLSSAQACEVWRLVERTNVNGIYGKHRIPLEPVVFAIVAGLRGPDRYQQMTKGERQKLSTNVQKTARKLRKLVEPLLKYDMPDPFRSRLLALSQESIKDYTEILEHWDGDAGLLEQDDIFEVCHSAINFTLHEYGLAKLLDLVAHACEEWSHEKQLLAMPNDENSKRLYFIRILTQHFYSDFQAPLRALTLALTSVFFECGDIDEASLSRLAPVPKRRTSRIDAAALSRGR